MSEQLGNGASGREAAVGTNSPAGEPLASSSSFVGSARRLSAIRDAVGEGALRLAYHAAVPVVVDADLLNLLRVNFFLDDPPDVLPFEVEAELLLSPLFREIGEGLYEIEPGLRNLLLSGLHTRYGDERVRRVAALLEQYTDAAAAWRSLPELELAQQLTALSFLDPAGAQRWLDVHEASAARPSSSSASSADDGPGREWYVAMRRRVAENSDITTIDTEIRYAGETLLQLLSYGDISARLSVIRSLESLASLPDTDADEVVTVLCAFIQKWDERSPGPSKRVTLDVQAALSLIGSLPHIEFRLEGVALTGANLAGLDFSYAIFDRVMLTELDARVLDLTYAQFSDVILSDANLDGAILDEAFLEFHTLRQVSLKGVSREGAYIAADTIQGVTGSRADGTPLEIRSLSAEDETMGFPAEVGLKEESAAEAPEDELPESGSPDESSSAESGTSLDVKAMLIEARTAEEAGQWERARDAYQAILDATGPGGLKNPDVRQGLVRCYFQLGEPDEAVGLLQSALVIYNDPGDPRRDFVVAAYVLAELGGAKLRMGLFDQAMEYLSNAVAAAHATGDPVHEARAEASLGTALVELGHASEAEEHYRLALNHYMGQRDIGREEAQVLLGLADLLVQQQRFAEAEASYRQALDILLEVGDRHGAVSTYHQLGSLAQEQGRFAEALEATQEAVTLRRALAADDPAAHQADLARSLADLGARLNRVGRYEEALEATQEAVTLRRALAADNPAAHQADLARSLADLGYRLDRVGRYEEALEAAQEAVTVFRALAADNPAAHQADLARSLADLGNRLDRVGRYEEALEATQEAVTLRRALAADNPAAHQADLARALANLGYQLNRVGRYEEALEATQEAVTLRRALAADNPAAHQADLARALANLGYRLDRVGRYEEALEATQEAVTLRRALAADNPAAHQADLARALANLGNRLDRVGRYEEALEATQEAVTLCRALAADNPAAHRDDLARALADLGYRLDRVDRPEEALAARAESVQLYRALALADPGLYRDEYRRRLTALQKEFDQKGMQHEAIMHDLADPS